VAYMHEEFSCIGDVGAVHCSSTKQSIVSKSSMEAEMVGLSNAANQGLHMRNFLVLQGYRMPSVKVSCMALIARGRSGAERTRHIAIRCFWTKERVDNGKMRIEHKGTKEMYANNEAATGLTVHVRTHVPYRMGDALL
jgi:alpha-D-ribose 1-methylphosphonate 5-triphosphate synthase subunit PhnL